MMPENRFEKTESRTIGCVLMASGKSLRYGTNKLLERLGGRELILHTAYHLREAGVFVSENREACLEIVAVTNDTAVRTLLTAHGFACVSPLGARKSDTMHAGLRAFASPAGFLFMPADQPLLRPETIRAMALRFLEAPGTVMRLSFKGVCGSPVIFPYAMKEELLCYEGEKGGRELLRPDAFGKFEAINEWELWDADTPESMEKIREVYSSVVTKQECVTS